MLIEGLRNTLVSPKSAMRAEKLLSIKMLLFTPSVDVEHPEKPTYTFQIGVNGWPVVEVFESASDICKLQSMVKPVFNPDFKKNAHQF